MNHKVLLAALTKVIADDRLKKSGNILHYIQSRELEEVLKIADKWFELPHNKPWDVFELGLELGRIAKQKPVMQTKLPNHMIYFIGTEAEVIKRLSEIPEKTAET
jgi:hypothetical protein